MIDVLRNETLDAHERLLACLRQEAIDRMPAACPVQTATLDLMKLSESFWPEAHFDAKKMARLSAAASIYAGFESARIPFDVVVDAEALGAKLGRADETTSPFMLAPRIADEDDLDDLDVSDPGGKGRVPLLVEAISELKRLVPDVPIICAQRAPFTLAAQLRGEERAMVDIASGGGVFEMLIAKTTEWGIGLANVLMDAGAEVITLLDTEASGSILGPDEFQRYAMPGETALAKAVSGKGWCSVVHVCADISLTTEFIADTGVNAISIGQGTSIRRTRTMVNDRCAIIGNIDPATTLLRGTPAEVAADTLRCIHEGVDIVAPGCALSPMTPLANIVAMSSTVKLHGEL
jgi:MtaA/CmuA family methyltransferase